MIFKNHKEIFKDSESIYLFSSRLPYLFGGKLIDWDFYIQPCHYSKAGKSIVGRYGDGESQYLVYAVWMINDKRFTIPSCFKQFRGVDLSMF